jgi:hypothetical protein
MGFDDLEEEEQNSDAKQTGSEDTPDVEVVDDTVGSGGSGDTDASSQDSISSEQAFSFSETEQDALYARPATWEGFEDLLDLDLEMKLRDRGIRNVSQSEKYDAALQVLTSYSTEIADQIESARKED